MKILKIVGKLVKWYIKLIIGFWALFGVSRLLRIQMEAKDPTDAGELNDEVFDEMNQNYKDWWRFFKG